MDEQLSAAVLPPFEDRRGERPTTDAPAGLVDFALAGLRRMELPSGLFCHDLVAGDPVPRGASLRYSLMTYIGLLKAQSSGHHHDFDVERTRAALLERLDARELRPGDFGLHLWADALSRGDRGAELLERLREELPAAGGLAALEGMEVAWIVQGLALQVAAGAPSAAQDLLGEALDHALGRAHPRSGLFEHTGRGARRRFPNFATQIYNVLALSTVAMLALDSNGRALGAACRAAERLEALQMADGGWPWLYDVVTGRVVERYEVYTVHQDAMAPMALLQLAEVTGDRRHVDAAGRGLGWIQGGNELRSSMFDPDEALLYRSIRRRRPWSRAFLYAATAAALTKAGRELPAAGTVELNRSDRPYHLGWVLEAWCGREDVLGAGAAA
jgi:hypothetical protein